MRWHVLWASLAASVLLAVGFVKLILMAGMKQQLDLILPILPLFYAVVFPALEKAIPAEAEPRRAGSRPAAAPAPARGSRRWSGALEPIVAGLAAGLAFNALLDLVFSLAYRRFVLDQGWPSPELPTGDAILGWFRGDLVPYSGGARLVFLTLEMIVVSAFAGLCVGVVSRTRPLLNGLIAGAIYAAWSGANQYASVYATILDFTSRLGERLPEIPWLWNYAMLGVLFLQVLLCAVASGLAFRAHASAAK